MSSNEVKEVEFKRGQVYIADLGEDVIGSEQGGVRPVVIIQNNVGNKYSPNVICIPLSTKSRKKKLPTHIYIDKSEYNEIDKDSIILADQMRTISKQRIVRPTPLVTLYADKMKEIEVSIKANLGIDWVQTKAPAVKKHQAV
ncbi:MAG: hypothetical protein ATN35_09205 [Epulopiscium sp. Nele67-Bin004]|nr:MAG: hypothetical protein ATN35_09205 [Epulopiscium sp. Nele67-Bin004]